MVSQSPLDDRNASDDGAIAGTADSALERYFAGWARLNKSMRRGDSWSGGERNAAFVRSASGPLHLIDAAPVIGLDYPDDARSAARIDIDFDGDDDLVVTNRTGPRVRVLANRWADGAPTVAVRLVGTVSNREGAGAVAFATPVAAGEKAPEELFRQGFTQRRTRAIGSGYLSQSSAWLRFAFKQTQAAGASRATRVPRVHLRVRWLAPDGGTVEDFGIVRANRRYILVEGSGSAREVSRTRSVVHAPGELVAEPTTDTRRRLVLPAPASIPSVLVRAKDGRAARLFGITPDGPRGIGRPVVLIAWDSADPSAIDSLGDIATLCKEATTAEVALVAVDLAAANLAAGAGGEPDPLLLGATRLAAAGWTGDVLGATEGSAILLRELVGWRFDRTEAPDGPWSFIIDPDGRLAILRTGAWAKGDFAADVEVLKVPAAQRPTVATPYPGLWANLPGDADLGRLRARLSRLGIDGAVRELDLARGSTVSIDSADVQIRLGQARLGRGDLEGALARFDAALSSEPEHVLGHRARAYTLHLLERYDEALAAWSEALRLDPLDTDTRGNRALAAVAAGKPGVARADLDVLLERESPTARVVLAIRRALDLAAGQGDDGK